MSRFGALLFAVGILGVFVPSAKAQGMYGRRPQPAPLVVYAPTAVPSPSPPPLGSFYGEPYIMTRGNFPTGGGYTPLNQYGDASMSLYGPLSSLRAMAAPVRTYVRGYDGRTAIVEGTSFSYPMLPALSPVIYPTQATYYYGFRTSSSPPWWQNGTTWVDQN